MTEKWEQDASKLNEYHVVEARRGREFILRLTTGADVYLAIQQFAIDHGIRFAKIHAAFMGGLQPAKFLVWAPDTSDPSNWHNESTITIQNQSMILSMSGVIHPRIMKGKEEPFPAIHFVTGGAWDVPTIGGHLEEGTTVKGVLEIFITEILGIDVLLPSDYDPKSDVAPESWYKQID
ncbi:MAG: DNA-binding protein [Candidatus Bathyarchaeota archaeon]|nr:DNA-binding protein [Candidatus Bathyarchaeota archaeon]